MAHLAATSNSLEAVKKHQNIIIQGLKDRDISVRRRALDLLYSMCDTSNAKVIVGELVRYLQVADYNLREDMVLKIAILTERFATEVWINANLTVARREAELMIQIVRVVRRYHPSTYSCCRRPCWGGSMVSGRPARCQQRRCAGLCCKSSV